MGSRFKLVEGVVIAIQWGHSDEECSRTQFVGLGRLLACLISVSSIWFLSVWCEDVGGRSTLLNLHFWSSRPTRQSSPKDLIPLTENIIITGLVDFLA